MAGTDLVSFSLAGVEELRPILTNEPLGAIKARLRIASARLSAPVDIPGAAPLVIRFKTGTELSLYVVNGKIGSDVDAVVDSDSTDAWVKYICTADVQLDARAPAGPLTFAGKASGGVSVVDYRHHPADTGLATAVASDLASPRVVFVREHVLALSPKDALEFETHGELTASVDIEWSDIFTSEIGTLTRILNARGPVAVETTIGATCSARVRVIVTFRVAFGATPDGTLRVAIRKGEVRRADIDTGLSVTVELDDRAALRRIADDVLAAVGLTDDAAAADVRERAIDALDEVARTKIGTAFAYEYDRMASDATLFEATIADGGLSPSLHAALVCGDVASAFASPPGVLSVTRYLNENRTTITKAWGFTLGIGPWQAMGRDRRRLTRVVRYDVAKELQQRSYIGSGGYERTHLKWMVDFKADMRAWSAEPVVDEYGFGLHVAWIRDKQTFTADDLETALDFAALWKICHEASLPWLRERLAPVVGMDAEWSFHVRLRNAALRAAARAIAAMTPIDLADAAAAAMNPGVERQPPAVRRSVFAPLWRVVLQGPQHFNVETVIEGADQTLSDPRAAWREREVASGDGVDPDTVAGTVRADPGMLDDCRRLIRGCRVLTDARATSARDDGVVEAVYGDLVSFWRQSHQVRMIGVLATDLTPKLDEVDRSLNIAAGEHAMVIGG